MKKALVITFSPLQFDSRVLRQIESLASSYQVTVCHPGPFETYPCEQVDLGPIHRAIESSESPTKSYALRLFLFRVFRTVLELLGAYRLALRLPGSPDSAGKRNILKLAGRSFDLVMANDVISVPLALSVAGSAPVVADLHEFAPGETTDSNWRSRARIRKMNWLCEHFLPLCSRRTVVSDSVSALYEEAFGVPSDVVPNMPKFHNLNPRPVNPDNIRLVHHGIYGEGRGIELLIESVARLPKNFSLHLLLKGAPTTNLVRLAESLGLDKTRFEIHDFVPPNSLISFLNQFDVELIFIPTSVSNHLAGLPNKFFEAVQARIAVVAGPLPELATRIKSRGLGTFTQSFEPAELASLLSELTDGRINKWKAASDFAAKEYCWEAVEPDYVSYSSGPFERLQD